eukprot:361810-Rhodomonas_salina.1
MLSQPELFVSCQWGQLETLSQASLSPLFFKLFQVPRSSSSHFRVNQRRGGPVRVTQAVRALSTVHLASDGGSAARSLR